ncbi:MAG: NUDIX domain-containing protein, partial [Rubrivivax sp.]
NLVGGGVPLGQTPWQALQREGWEEAGLSAQRLSTAKAGRIVSIERSLVEHRAEGWQREHIHSFDLQLPTGERPENQDGEVAGFHCLPLAQALTLAAGSTMTVDAALVTLDFALRHQLLGARAGALATAAASLWVAPGVR